MTREDRAAVLFPVLRPGDIACTSNPSAVLGKLINAWQARMSWDGEASRSHSLIIVDSAGRTFESGIRQEGKRGWWIGHGNLFRDYAGGTVTVLRHDLMTPEIFYPAYFRIRDEYDGRRYPIHRLLLFLASANMARWLHWAEIGVCSEIVARLLTYCEVDGQCGRYALMGKWAGAYPDFLADFGDPRWGRKGWRTIFEGPVPAVRIRPVRVAA